MTNKRYKGHSWLSTHYNPLSIFSPESFEIVNKFHDQKGENNNIRKYWKDEHNIYQW